MRNRAHELLASPKCIFLCFLSFFKLFSGVYFSDTKVTIELADINPINVDHCTYMRKRDVGWSIWHDLAGINRQRTTEKFVNYYFPPFKHGNRTFRNQHLSQIDNRRIDFSYQDNYPDFPDDSYKWTGVKGTADDTMWGTMFSQSLIWKHQFPLTCEDKKMVAVENQNWGMGAVLKHMSRALGWALVHGRIMDFGNQSWIWTNGSFCNGINTPLCFFKPITNCSVGNSTDVINAMHHGRSGYLGSTAGPKGFRVNNIVPKKIKDMLSVSPMLFVHMRMIYYWEVQAFTFLCRFRKRLVKWILANHVQDSSLLDGIDVNMHVRHGDKQGEMALIPTQEYLWPVFVYRNMMRNRKQKMTVFISTEDEKAITELQKVDYLDVRYLKHERVNGGYFQFSEQAMNVALISFANLYMNMRGTIDVTTVRSNWNRMVMCLRNTVGYKGNSYTFEVGTVPGKCYTAEHCRCVNFKGIIDDM